MTAQNPTKYVNEFGQPLYPKKILLSVPPAMLHQIEYITQQESRTRSDLVREALRRYIADFNRTRSPLGQVPAYTRPVVQRGEGPAEEVVTYRENAVIAGVH